MCGLPWLPELSTAITPSIHAIRNCLDMPEGLIGDPGFTGHVPTWLEVVQGCQGTSTQPSLTPEHPQLTDSMNLEPTQTSDSTEGPEYTPIPSHSRESLPQCPETLGKMAREGRVMDDRSVSQCLHLRVLCTRPQVTQECGSCAFPNSTCFKLDRTEEPRTPTRLSFSALCPAGPRGAMRRAVVVG